MSILLLPLKFTTKRSRHSMLPLTEVIENLFKRLFIRNKNKYLIIHGGTKTPVRNVLLHLKSSRMFTVYCSQLFMC
jgi:hypothetical protein